MDSPPFFPSKEALDAIVAWLQGAVLLMLKRISQGDASPLQGTLLSLPEYGRFAGTIPNRMFPHVSHNLVQRPFLEGYKQFIHLQVSADLWKDYFATQLIRQLRTDSPYAVPEELWEVLCQWAWVTPKFTRDAAQIIETFLQQYVLFSIGDFITIRFAPNTLWLLLAIGTSPAVKGFRGRTRAASNSGPPIQQIAQKRGLQPNYASFLGSMDTYPG